MYKYLILFIVNFQEYFCYYNNIKVTVSNIASDRSKSESPNPCEILSSGHRKIIFLKSYNGSFGFSKLSLKKDLSILFERQTSERRDSERRENLVCSDSFCNGHSSLERARPQPARSRGLLPISCMGCMHSFGPSAAACSTTTLAPINTFPRLNYLKRKIKQIGKEREFL